MLDFSDGNVQHHAENNVIGNVIWQRYKSNHKAEEVMIKLVVENFDFQISNLKSQKRFWVKTPYTLPYKWLGYFYNKYQWVVKSDVAGLSKLTETFHKVYPQKPISKDELSQWERK